MINIGILDFILFILVSFFIYVNFTYLKTSHLIKLVILVCLCCVFGLVRGYNFGIVDLLISILIYDFLLLLLIQQKPASLPPGPSPLPIIGNVLDLGDGKRTVDVFRSLRKKYGDIFCLSLGSYWVVVVNGQDNLREIFVKNGKSTSDRPPLYTINIFKNKGIVSSNGSNWKAQRAFTISKLREFGFGKKSFESSIIDELNQFLQWIQQYKGKPLALEGILNASTANSLMQIILGKRFDYKDPKYCDFLEIFNQIITSPALNGPVNFMPWLANLPGDFFGVKADTLKLDKVIDYFKNEIQEHKRTFDEDNIRDFIDVYLKEMKIQERSTSNMLNEDQLASVLTDFFGGGTETTATVIKWTILLLLNNMTVQNKMRQEIEEVIGSGRLPTLADKPKMPYCEAVILESLRFGNIGPLSLPHLVSEEIVYKDLYVIPKGSVIIPCLDSVAFDETWFPESHVFKPERFIDEKGNLCNQDKIVTFSLAKPGGCIHGVYNPYIFVYLDGNSYCPDSGRRVCPGESLARMELFLYLTSMVQRFEFLPVEGENPPPVDPLKGLLNSPQPYNFRAIATQ